MNISRRLTVMALSAVLGLAFALDRLPAERARAAAHVAAVARAR